MNPEPTFAGRIAGRSAKSTIKSIMAAVALAALLALAACSNDAPAAPPPPAPTPVPAQQEAAAQPPATQEQSAATQPADPAVDADAPTQEPAPEDAAAQETIPPLALDQIKLDLQAAATGLDQPLFVTHAGDGSARLFIVEKVGQIRIVQDGELLDAPFLDIHDRVRSQGSEQGLLGLAFAPDYAETGYFFVNYSDADGNTVIARFQAQADNPNVVDADSEVAILQILQPASNHNGGMLAFGPDGYLYIGMGDGGASFDRFDNGQNPATLLGKMLRIDVTSDPSAPYLIPPDNPWVGEEAGGDPVRDEIWAFGLRNPWRFSFDRQTQDLWIGDVGQNQYEEIDFTPAGSPGGLNYGWPIMEGASCVQGDACDREGLEQPILVYDHSGHCSVTGGYVYRGSAYPGLEGTYFYGDYCSGTIWAARADGQGGWQNVLVQKNDGMISSFGEDEAGELYLADIAGGAVYRLGLAQ